MYISRSCPDHAGRVAGGEVSTLLAVSKSIAVLPFKNLSSDAENEYFSDGMTEEIINALSQIGGLKVTARTSSFVFKNTRRDIRQIGKELVSYGEVQGSNPSNGVGQGVGHLAPGLRAIAEQRRSLH